MELELQLKMEDMGRFAEKILESQRLMEESVAEHEQHIRDLTERLKQAPAPALHPPRVAAQVCKHDDDG